MIEFKTGDELFLKWLEEYGKKPLKFEFQCELDVMAISPLFRQFLSPSMLGYRGLILYDKKLL